MFPSEEDSTERILHVLDLPQLYTRPSAPELLSTLGLLAIHPHSWHSDQSERSNRDEQRARVDEGGVPKYLTGVISSDLGWVEEQDVREEIWETACRRMAERSGRTAQPTLTRTFEIPGSPAEASLIQIQLREPSLTADNLGHKTWLASFLLARRLSSLRHLLPLQDHLSTSSQKILELGSGTGLLGIAAAALFSNATVHLTDLEAIVPNLEANVKANESLFSIDKSPSVGVLDWSETPTGEPECCYDLILASDPLYSPSHPAWLVDTIARYLDRHATSRVVIELSLRDAYLPQVEELRERMVARGLLLSESGEELGTEDWGDHKGLDRPEVRCWWGVWSWRQA